jgi:glycosyltransferase involved in cell wall biosynthesis
MSEDEIPFLPFDPVSLNMNDVELPNVSILIPCYKRRNFIPLMITNINTQDYPKEKLELVILQDGEEDLFIDKTRLELFRQSIYPVKLKYIYEPKVRRSIGEKRNKLVKLASHKIYAMMDSDDLYLSTYIRYSVNALKQYKAGISSSACMTFVYPKYDFRMTAIRCGHKRQCHEACAVFTKKYFNKMGGFGKTSQGEGIKMLSYNDREILNLDINRLMVCIAHDDNTIDKEQFSTQNREYATFKNDNLQNLIKNVLNL